MTKTFYDKLDKEFENLSIEVDASNWEEYRNKSYEEINEIHLKNIKQFLHQKIQEAVKEMIVGNKDYKLGLSIAISDPERIKNFLDGYLFAQMLQKQKALKYFGIEEKDNE